MELDCNDKIQRLASSKAYVETLENQLKELKHSNHIMKVSSITRANVRIWSLLELFPL
jgi:predicted ATPase